MTDSEADADPAIPGPDRRRLDLRADCANCVGLCCVVPAFAASADFAIDKDAGRACPNLRPDFRCGIHHRLRPAGFTGCTVYDCFGAGQKVAQLTFAGQNWRDRPETAAPMFAVFAVMRQLQELLWYLADALTRPAAAPLRGQLERAYTETERLTLGSPDELTGFDVEARRRPVSRLLRKVSELVRADPGADLSGTDLSGTDLSRADLSGADLIGADLRGADLRGAVLRGAYLIGADLRRADLRRADLIGADLRAADLRGADLTASLFLTQFQLNAANGDSRTAFPAALTRPGHWTVQDPGKRSGLTD